MPAMPEQPTANLHSSLPAVIPLAVARFAITPNEAGLACT